MKINRLYTTSNKPVVDQIQWKICDANIPGANFEMKKIEAPAHWTQTAVNILAQKYFRKAGIPQKVEKDNTYENVPDWLRPAKNSISEKTGGETSAKQVFHRLAGHWTYTGFIYNYFENEKSAQAFYDEIYYMLAMQIAAPNSPQWFNTGLYWAYGIAGPDSGQWAIKPNDLFQTNNSYEYPQVHACQPGWATVSTPNGLIPISEIEIGDVVFSSKGEQIKVLAKKRNGIKEVFRIELANGNYIEATADHKVLACLNYDHNKKLKSNLCWIEIGKLEPGMRLVQRNDLTVNVTETSNISEAFLVGFLQGDGYQSRNKLTSPCIELMTINEEEHHIVMNAVNEIFQGFKYNITEIDNNSELDIKRIRFYGRNLLPFLDKYELTDDRWAENMRVPTKIMKSDHKTICAYLSAFFQAEGCVRIKKNAADIVIVSISKQLLEDIQHLLLSVGIYSRLMPSYEARENRKPCFSLVIAYKSERNKFKEKIGFISNDKKMKLEKSLEFSGKEISPVRFESITEISSIGDHIVWDIQTESENYLSNGIVVHNCYIQPVNDDLVNSGGILDLVVREGRLFKHGSGTGTNFSNIRGKGEKLSGGGTSSGLMSFLEILDKAAGAIKSGGTTRRAAKMICLDLDHPEIEDFINLKVREEAKAAAMYVGSKAIIARTAHDEDDTFPKAMLDRLDNGISMEEFSCGWEGEAIRTVGGQNANNSVRITDAFLEAVRLNGDWDLVNRTDGKVSKTIPARELWDQINRAAWASADPGLQFHDTINSWNTCANDGIINATNPCFVGTTLVDTSEGLIPIEKLADMDGQNLPHAFGFDRNTALPALRKITKAWCSGYRNELVNVKLDTGEEFTCTPDHKWLLRNGEYVEAQNLRKGMSLRKIGRTINEERSSRCSILHRCTDEVPNGTQYQSRWMWEQVYGPIPKGMEVHHKDNDPSNDRLSNLELIKSTDHRINHMSGSNNPRYMIVSDKVLVEIYDAVIASAKYKIKTGVTVGKWNAYIRANNLIGKVPLAQSPTVGGKIQGMYWHEFVAKMEGLRAEVNAKVVSITTFKTNTPIAVYDITVEGIHNFGIRGNNIKNQPSVVVSNCSEYNFLNNTACNLASLNLVKFLKQDNIDPKSRNFDIESFIHATKLWTIVLDISVSMASFPSREIAEGSYNYRTLGLGYANVGGLLMRSGIAYDSDIGRNYISTLTALMHGVTLQTSIDLAKKLGPFPRWEANKNSMEKVVNKHKDFALAIDFSNPLKNVVQKIWLEIDPTLPFRNAQTTLIAPTGTIALLMDCDTTGIEPDFALIKTKSLIGGGVIETINTAVSDALTTLGYSPHQRNLIIGYVNKYGTVENCPDVKNKDHLAVFDCAVPAKGFSRCLSPISHVKMVAAVQPFLSGGVSKTVNLPHNATIEDVANIHSEAHSRGVKCIAIYRDGCKLTQPLNIERKSDRADTAVAHTSISPEITYSNPVVNYTNPTNIAEIKTENPRGKRETPSNRLNGYRQKVRIDGQSFYIRTGEYDDGRLAEIFLDFSKDGSTLGGLINSLAKAVSIGLQYGVPLSEFVKAFTHVKFDPLGIVEGHEKIKFCSSIIDLIFRDLGIEYLNMNELANVKVEENKTTILNAKPSGEFCICGGQLVQNGTCKVCIACGSSNGGCG